MTEPVPEDLVRQGLRTGEIHLKRVGRVINGPGLDEPYVLLLGSAGGSPEGREAGAVRS